jgi:hypothetical protein
MKDTKKYWEEPFDCQRWWTSPSRAAMSLTARGLYREMLDYQWMEGSVPDDPKIVAALLGRPESEIGPVWEQVRGQFSRLKNGTLRNRRMEQIRGVKIGLHSVCIDNKKKAANVRWSNERRKHARALQTDANDRTIERKNEEDPPTPHSDFRIDELAIWLIREYPEHRQRGPWQNELVELVDQDHAANRPAGYSETLIRAGLPRFKVSQQWRDGKIENLAKWLHEKLFMHPPPEREGNGLDVSSQPANVAEVMRQRRERLGK